MKKILLLLLLLPLFSIAQNTTYVEQDIPLPLPEGWSIFGYSCVEPIDATEALEPIIDNVVIVKDYQGIAYLPTWDFNGIGDLEYSRGYQIKLTQEITDFQFCPAIVPLVDLDGDGIYDVDEIEGCMDISACNYNELATDDGICEFPIEGYDCEGIPQYQVGDFAEGGIIFYIDETGEHGLVSALEDLGQFEWGCYGTSISGADGQAIGTGYQNTLDIVAQNCQTQNGGITAAQATLIYSFEGYTEWYLPSNEELKEMYNTIGIGGSQGNIGGFETSDFPYYWSSSEFYNGFARVVNFSTGYSNFYDNNFSLRVHCIRAF